MVSEREIEAAIKAIEAVPIMGGDYSLSGEDAKAAARAALEAAARVRAEANAGGPVAWGEDIDGKIVSVRLDKSRHCTVPLYPAPQPSGTVEVDDIAAIIYSEMEWASALPGDPGEPIISWDDCDDSPAFAKGRARAAARRILSALTAGKPEQAVPSEAELFDRADWYWRTMDPDDSGDSPEEAINRLGNFVVCEIASSFTGPTRYGFTAPVLDPDSDDTEFLHFPTQEEAIEAAKQRAAMLSAAPAAPAADEPMLDLLREARWFVEVYDNRESNSEVDSLLSRIDAILRAAPTAGGGDE